MSPAARNYVKGCYIKNQRLAGLSTAIELRPFGGPCPRNLFDGPLSVRRNWNFLPEKPLAIDERRDAKSHECDRGHSGTIDGLKVRNPYPLPNVLARQFCYGFPQVPRQIQ